MKREDLVEFHRETYLNGGFRIFVAGDFGDKELELLNSFIGKLPNDSNNEQSEERWNIDPSKDFRHNIKKDNAVQNAIRMGFVGIHRDHEDYFGLKILSTILGGYFGSRLMTNIREDKGYTYGIGSAYSSMSRESLFFISTELKSEVVDLAIEEIFKEIDRLKTDLVDEGELFTVKNYMQGSIQRSFDGSFALLDRYKEIELNSLDNKYYHRYVEKIKQINAKELKDLAQKYFDNDKIYILSVGN